MENQIILVDRNDNPIGQGPKLAVHQQGLLHRAFSIYIFNDNDQLLIQKRNRNKYHSGGLWSNTCCSHPRVGESLEDAAVRRLQEEMGIATPLKEIFNTIYKVSFDNGLKEHEFLHVIIGNHTNTFRMNPEEAEDAKWISIDELKKDMKKHPKQYSYWFKKCLGEVAKRAFPAEAVVRCQPHRGNLLS